MFDYHLHTKLCGHAKGEMEDYVLAAIQKGFNEIGFSDHTPLEYLPDIFPEFIRKSYGMPESKLEWYISEIDGLRKKYRGQILIKTGMELDYMAWNQDNILKFINKLSNRLDYVIGSVHMIKSPGIGIWSIDDSRFLEKYSIIGVDNVYSQYLNELSDLIKTEAYDIIGHIDLVKKFGFRPSDKTEYFNRIDEILNLIKSKEMIVECNTAGLRKKVGEIYPEIEILKKIIAKDIPMIISSDAHRPEEVGYKFNETLQLLRKLGLNKLCLMTKRRKKYESI
ncbi:MAG: histidinol-phosphatase HisJ [Promethearchaeota archaeon]